MAISEFEIKRCERELEKFIAAKRPAPNLRHKLDLGYRIENQSVELFEIRPEWRNPAKIMQLPIAKATYVKTDKIWKIYWQRQDLRWHRYDPVPQVKQLEEFLSVVDEDAHACFFG